MFTRDKNSVSGAERRYTGGELRIRRKDLRDYSCGGPRRIEKVSRVGDDRAE
jgi:hypothetical protein